MSNRDQLYPPDQRAWLLAIGRRLRVEYDAIAMSPQIIPLKGRTDFPGSRRIPATETIPV